MFNRVLNVPLLDLIQFVKKWDFRELLKCGYSHTYQVSWLKLKRCVPSGHWVAQCQLRDITIFLTYTREMSKGSINLGILSETYWEACKPSKMKRFVKTGNGFQPSEVAVCRCFSQRVLLKILQYAQENTRVGVSFQ